MKILYITTHLDNGGAEKLIADMAIYSKKKGLEVTVLMILNRKGVPYENLMINKIKVINLNKSSLHDFALSFTLYNISKKFDIIHTHTYYAQLYSSLFISKKKLITTEHSTNNNRRNKKIFKLIDSLMYFKYSKIVSITDSVEKNLKKWIISKNKDKFSVINNGIDVEKYFNDKKVEKEQIGFKKKETLLISVGRLEPVKNQLLLLDAFSEIRDPNVKLILIGNGSLKPEILKKIKNKNLFDRVTLLENIKNIDTFLKASDVFVLPSLWEGFGLSALEAAISGNTLVLSDIEGLKDMIDEVTEQALFFDPVSKDELLKTILKAISMVGNDEKSINIDYVQENLSIQSMMDKYLKVYKEIKGG
ncbi:glycosyltransferase [Exiguobacterium sp. R-39]|uniref:glycosyltransferase n=1 Tax=Exiguobacterium sp. R-39 TaxID=3416708 RepID=UPI003CFAD47E